MMKTLAIIEKGKDGTFGVFTPDLKNTVISGDGNTVKEAKKHFIEGYKMLLDGYAEHSEEIPDYLKNLEFEYKYDIASIFDELAFINVSKFAEEIGICPSLMRKYKTDKNTYISEQQSRKIEQGFHMIAKKFSAISLEY